MGYPTKTFNTNTALSPKQRRMAEWKPIRLDELFFRSIFRYGCQLKSALNLEDQEATLSELCPVDFQEWLNLLLGIIHTVRVDGSWKPSHPVKVQFISSITSAVQSYAFNSLNPWVSLLWTEIPIKPLSKGSRYTSIMSGNWTASFVWWFWKSRSSQWLPRSSLFMFVKLFLLENCHCAGKSRLRDLFLYSTVYTVYSPQWVLDVEAARRIVWK